jgi:hypothetical protein
MAKTKMLNRKRRARTWRWITRDKIDWLTWSNFIEVHATVKKPRWNECFNSYVSQESAKICCKEFKRLFGFVPKPGECLKVEFSAKVVKQQERRS